MPTSDPDKSAQPDWAGASRAEAAKDSLGWRPPPDPPRPPGRDPAGRRRDLRPPAPLLALLAATDVRLNGERPWDIRVHDPAVYDRVLRDGALGLGETYMEGGWDSAALDETFCRLLVAGLDQRIHGTARLRFALLWLAHVLVNRQSRSRAFEVGRRHYDIGNDIYAAMLDTSMSYSCGYWADATNLEQAQQAKLALICRKLELAPGMRLLDLGCGWGGLAAYAARHHGCEVLGITVSGEQQRLARARCAGLPVTIELLDYRALEPALGRAGAGRFERIASVGMFEHVGPGNYDRFFGIAHRLLADDGLFLLHSIGSQRPLPINDPWIDKYIFPNGHVPSAPQLTRALAPWFLFEDWHNFGADYDRTLMAWWQRFDAAWPALPERYDEVFYRMWKYYLLSCAGMFRARAGQVWQLVLCKRGRSGGYRSVR